MTWDNHLFIIVMFIAYFDYTSSIIRLALGLYSCSCSAYLESQGVSGRRCVGVVLRHHLSANAPYVLGHVVDREGDYYSFVESSVVHSSNIGLVEPRSGEERLTLFLTSLLRLLLSVNMG